MGSLIFSCVDSNLYLLNQPVDSAPVHTLGSLVRLLESSVFCLWGKIIFFFSHFTGYTQPSQAIFSFRLTAAIDHRGISHELSSKLYTNQ